MMFIYTADLHLTTLPNDEYRWSVFSWLRKRVEHYGTKAVFILGDLTDRKDEHPAALVDRLVRELRKLARLAPVYMIKGNHDYIDASTPFFGFLNGIDGLHFFTKPHAATINGVRFLFLPHTRSFKDYADFDLASPDRVCIHQAVSGAVGSNGYPIEGVPLAIFRKCRQVIAGDIHTPQPVGKKVMYTGAPHPVFFGDHFTPRVLLDDGTALKSLERHCLKKMTVTLTDVEHLIQSGMDAGDMAKVTVTLPRSEFVNWDQHRARLRTLADEMGISLHGIKLAELQPRRRLRESVEQSKTPSFNPMAVWDRFCVARKVDVIMADAGRALLV